VKRYLVFAGATYYPGGGWCDYCGDADTLEKARALAKKPTSWATDWHQIVDTTTGKEVEGS